jgi:glutathione synthase/RimK-type ligase-like ATP-grasp enzyme
VRIALASCNDLPDWEVDDAPLHDALRARGADLRVLPWDAPGVDWGGFDAVLVRTTWDYQARPAAFLAWADRVGPRLHNPAAVIRWNLDKRYLRALAAEGVPLAPTVWLEPGDAVDLGAVLDARGWEAGFLKPVVGASARATHRFSRQEAAAAQSWLAPVLAREAMMLQPYLPAVEGFGEVSAICIEGEEAHWVRKVPVPGDYRVQDDHGASDEPFAPAVADRALARGVLAAARRVLGRDAPLLYARVDLLRDGAGAWVLTELELVEPSLFFRHGPGTAELLAGALLRRAGA